MAFKQKKRIFLWSDLKFLIAIKACSNFTQHWPYQRHSIKRLWWHNSIEYSLLYSKLKTSKTWNIQNLKLFFSSENQCRIHLNWKRVIILNKIRKRLFIYRNFVIKIQNTFGYSKFFLIIGWVIIDRIAVIYAGRERHRSPIVHLNSN